MLFSVLLSDILYSAVHRDLKVCVPTLWYISFEHKYIISFEHKDNKINVQNIKNIIVNIMLYHRLRMPLGQRNVLTTFVLKYTLFCKLKDSNTVLNVCPLHFRSVLIRSMFLIN